MSWDCYPKNCDCRVGLTLETRARCVARPCCKKAVLWALPKLYNTTFSTAPKMLSRASDSITVWESEIQLLGIGVATGSGKERDSGVRDHKALCWAQRAWRCWIKPYLHDDLQCVQNHQARLSCQIPVHQGLMFHFILGPEGNGRGLEDLSEPEPTQQLSSLPLLGYPWGTGSPETGLTPANYSLTTPTCPHGLRFVSSA